MKATRIAWMAFASVLVFMASTDGLYANELSSRPLHFKNNDLDVQIQITPGLGSSADGKVVEGKKMSLSLKISDGRSGLPLQALGPAVWIDFKQRADLGRAEELSCSKKIGIFLSNGFARKPLINLNRFLILVLNEDATISVLDPTTGVKGITKLFALVQLKSPGGDWVKSRDENFLYVSMPKVGQVAIIDTKEFKVVKNVEAGESPLRLVHHPSKNQLWVGNRSPSEGESGVTVLDSRTGKQLRQILTGKGHHEIAFSITPNYVFVTNRDSGTVTVIDGNTLEVTSTLKTGRSPLAILYSKIGEAVYVVDGLDGTVSVIDKKSLRVKSTMRDVAGLGPMRLAPGGKYAFLLNHLENTAIVIDTSANKIVHRIPVGARPFQVNFTQTYAYVRSMSTEKVRLISLAELGNTDMPAVAGVSVGTEVGDWEGVTSLSNSISPAPHEAAALIANRADNTIYYYMEGMVAPMGSFRNYGHRPIGVNVVGNLLKEGVAGTYSAQVVFPVAADYDLIVRLQKPRLSHCFQIRVSPDPDKPEAIRVDYLNTPRNAIPDQVFSLRFRLLGERTGKEISAKKQVDVLFYALPNGGRIRISSKYQGDGIYEALLPITKSGGHYAFITSPELQHQPATRIPFSFRSASEESGDPKVEVRHN